MRYSRVELRCRVNGRLSIRNGCEGLTSYAGLELIRQYFTKLSLNDMIRRTVGSRLPGSDYGSVSMLLLVLTLLISGGRRVRHVEYLRSDPLVLRCCGLKRLPSGRTLGRWLSGFEEVGLSKLSDLNWLLALSVIRESKIRRLTLDVDGTVISTGQTVEGAERGFNPHHRKVPSYYPITAYEANTGQVLSVLNRPGNVHDGKASVGFVGALIEQLRAGLGSGHVLEWRMDGAFFRADVLDLLAHDRSMEYAIKVPFYPWLGLKQRIMGRRRWQRVTNGVDCFECRHRVETWGRTLRMVIYRKRVFHKTAKNFQLDLFDPDDGYYEYSAVATNKRVTGRTLWHFMNARGTHEKVYGELKSGLAFGCVPTHGWHANGVWQTLSILAFNLTRGFQRTTMAPRRKSNRKRRSIWRFESIHTLRYRILHRAGRLVRSGGRQILDIGTAPVIFDSFSAIENRLKAV